MGEPYSEVNREDSCTCLLKFFNGSNNEARQSDTSLHSKYRKPGIIHAMMLVRLSDVFFFLIFFFEGTVLQMGQARRSKVCSLLTER